MHRSQHLSSVILDIHLLLKQFAFICTEQGSLQSIQPVPRCYLLPATTLKMRRPSASSCRPGL
ncbi:hypothetical protein H8959_013861, partial [Pygathrix nigripes]